MKRALIEILFLICLSGKLLAEPFNPVQQLPLNPLALTRIPVSLNGPTTIRFPSPISDLEGAFISSDPSSSALFLLSFRPGNSFFSVRALVGNTNTSMNIVWKDQTYVLELVESKQPWLSVIFTQSAPATTAATQSHPAVTPSRLLGLIDTAKAYSLLKTQHPEAVAGVICVHTNTLNDYGEYTIRTEEIFRFDESDTLVFRIVVSNKTDRVMRFLPQSLMVQAGQRVFYQSITDARGEVPAQSSVTVYFAITGTVDGGRNDVSPRNDFLVLLHRMDVPIPSAPQAQTKTNSTIVEKPSTPTISPPLASQQNPWVPKPQPTLPAAIPVSALPPTHSVEPQQQPVMMRNYAPSPARPVSSSVPIYYADQPVVQPQATYYYNPQTQCYYINLPAGFDPSTTVICLPPENPRPRWIQRLFGP